MLGPRVDLALPPFSWFKFPPDPQPTVVPPPVETGELRSLFAIDTDVYNALLAPAVPITFAAGYLITVLFLNSYNRRNGNKPWDISKTNLFQSFVILHNIFLACFSAISCIAMARAVYVSMPPGHFLGKHGLPATVDALCKMHGPRGYGDAVTYSARSLAWEAKNKLIHLAPNALTPDDTDVGRIWNEGLAFWGWIFYLSKFYEVVDTLIIIAKGKRCSTLQMYHHAGAMFSMWAGIRYMSPPIWMFVLVNAGIHTLMYTYYSLAVLKVPVSLTVKRAITTMQISQFIIGITYASIHLFVSYTIPVSVAYSIASSVSAAASSASEVATSDMSGWLKRLALRAAGAEGLAERVEDESSLFGNELAREFRHREPETRWRNHYERVHCLDTSGQAFAIGLNLLYLAPLTLLFMRFFLQSYVYGKPARGQQVPGAKREGRRMSESADYAARRTSDSVESFGREIERSMDSVSEEVKQRSENSDIPQQVGRRSNEFKESTKTVRGKAEEVRNSVAKTMEEIGGDVAGQAKDITNKAAGQAKDLTNKAAGKAKEVKDYVVNQAQGMSENAAQIAQETKDDAAGKLEDIKQSREFKSVQENAADVAQKTRETAKDAAGKLDDVKQNTDLKSIKDSTGEVIQEGTKKVQKTANDAAGKLDDVKQNTDLKSIKDSAGEVIQEGTKKVQKTANDAAGKLEDVKQNTDLKSIKDSAGEVVQETAKGAQKTAKDAAGKPENTKQSGNMKSINGGEAEDTREPGKIQSIKVESSGPDGTQFSTTTTSTSSSGNASNTTTEGSFASGGDRVIRESSWMSRNNSGPLFTGSGQQVFATSSASNSNDNGPRVIEQVEGPGGASMRSIDQQSNVDFDGNIRVDDGHEETMTRSSDGFGDGNGEESGILVDEDPQPPSSPDGGFGLNG